MINIITNYCKECKKEYPDHFILCETCGKKFTIYDRQLEQRFFYDVDIKNKRRLFK